MESADLAAIPADLAAGQTTLKVVSARGFYSPAGFPGDEPDER